MEPMAKFIGFEVPPGKEQGVNAEIDEDMVTTFHFTQIALGDKPGKGPHTVFIENEDGKFAVGTLNRDTCTHFSVDITIAGDAIVFSHSGPSPVHVTGYLTQEPLGYEEDSEDDMMGYRGALGSDDDTDMDDSEEDEEESDDDEAPMAVPLSGGKQARAHMDNDDDSSEEEDSDDEEEGDEDDSSEEEEEESEEEEEPPAAAKKRKAAPQTPQPAKKSKADALKAPATAPAKVTDGGATPANEAEYAKALKAYLQQNGPKRIAELGSAVKRPPKSPKMKKFFEAHKDTFNYNETTQTVSLA